MVATIGSFDGVHRGHLCLLKQVRDIADERGIKAAAVTFTSSPKRVLGGKDVAQLNGLRERLLLLQRSGVDEIHLLDFTHDMAKMTAYDFMRQVLKEKFGVEVLVIGYDHRFGCNRTDGFDDYVRYGKELGIEVVRGEACMAGDAPVSSTRIRQCLAEGKVSDAAQLLGYNYKLCGKVVDGYKVGRKLGFPTANIDVRRDNKLLPADGVYAVCCRLAEEYPATTDSNLASTNEQWIGMLNIGHRPTINNGTERSIEVHILDFEGDLYGKSLCIEFVERLREERSFENLEELTSQLAADREKVKNMFPSTHNS